ncbi:hypothetical protein [Neobacillus sp. PS3-40]|uniref:hypothetical protein n=1 Tax=Neobacillus sp. PS3-40 TaxID=3070679 RepID=UPI0027DEDD10|nr:hypothetical protein [Neobacillus sp. PS3-40]WML45236.1 hypothetical protein RCG20_04840 [Neobacillus sp. PS3-40]
MNFQGSFPNDSHLKNSPFSFKAEQNTLSSPQSIKVLVEIANSMFEFDISKKIKMNPRINEVQDINWSTSPVDYQININAKKLWLSSNLIAEIIYTKITDPRVYSQTITIPWKKTCNLEYNYPPIVPLSNKKKHYEFTQQHPDDTSNEHYEQIIYNNDKPVLEIVSTKIVTSKDIITNKFSYLFLNINCEVFFRLFQNQVLHIK